MSSSTMTVPASPATKRRVRPGSVALWVVQVVLATQFLGAGLMKLAGSQTMVDMFAEIGVGQWFRYLVGALELAGAIGLVVPRWCGPAALGLAGVMAGAIVTNVVVIDESPATPVAFLVIAAAIAWFRRATIMARLTR